MKSLMVSLALLLACGPGRAAEVKCYDVPKGAHPHDVAPDPDTAGPVWYTAQHQGALGRLDSVSGKVEQIPLGEGSAPHGVILGPDGVPWLSDFGANAIVRFDPETETFESFPSTSANAAVRQMLGRKGEAWGAESGADRLVVVEH